jgi:glycosyltransferase involved in cell wall biosynthesis
VISVVVPTYQREHLIGRALHSVLDQRPCPDEVIVVDDGSTDGTARVLEGFGPRVRVLRQANAGGAAARNHGVQMATSEWVAFCDSDDVWCPGHLDRLLGAVTATGGAADLYFDDVHLSPSYGGDRLFALAGLHPDPLDLRHDARSWAVLPRQPTMLQASLVRRQAYLASGGLWPALTSRHDTHFFYRMLLDRPACAVAGVGVAMSDDAPTSQRLTSGRGLAQGRRYWSCTVLLYSDLLQQRDDRAERRILADLAARGHKRLARSSWADGRPAAAMVELARGLRTSPVTIPWSLLAPGRDTPGVGRARRALATVAGRM